MSRPASTADRIATRLLERVGTRLWGFPPRLMLHVVRRLGAFGALRWFAVNMPRYERTVRRFGALRTHLLCLQISLVNGCPYCSFGHAYAFELVFLRDRGRLLPIDEHAIVALHLKERDAIASRLREELEAAGLAAELPWLERINALIDGTTKSHGADEQRLAHLVEMFAVLNACGIDGNVLPDEAHDPVNKDAELRHRYTELRAAETVGG